MLYDALREILVTDGPLENLYLNELPDEQTADVDVAAVPLSGIGATRALGSQPVVGGPRGVEHDGGVLWWHTGVQLQARGRDRNDPRPVAVAADAIRDVLAQFAGEPVEHAGERIVRCEVSVPPAYYGQDERRRPIMALTVECWHRPA